MAVTIKSLRPTFSELYRYVKFGIDLYKGNPCFVPPLILDEIQTLNPKTNPAFDHCQAQSFMAYLDGKPVGRITAIINSLVNEKNGEQALRFGFVDFIDDDEVVDALFDAVIAWGRERSCTAIVGPMGFSDMDHEGMLIEGFDEMGTMATIYNYDYYPRQMQRLGFAKDVDWIEYRMTVPDKVPDKYMRIADIVQRKYDLQIRKYTSRKKIKREYGHALFELINEAYADLYGFSPLTPRQIEYYISQYIPVLRLRDVSVITKRDGELVAVGISMPSLSSALRRCGGHLLPTGWYHLLRAIRGHSDVVDLLLVAVKPEYQNKGVNALLFSDLLPGYIENGYKFAESNVALEGNEKVQKQWEYFERRQHRRRRAFKKQL